MIRLIVAYVIAAVAFGCLDAVWLTQSYGSLYYPEIGRLTLSAPDPLASAAFYLLYLVGVVRFAVAPALKSGGIATALVQGAFLGLVAYGTYDLTNLATLKNWTLKITLVDMAWGVVATSTASVVSTFLTSKLVKA
jgi:uncharacterized membrane protein